MSNRFMRRRVEGEEFWLDLEGGRFYGVNETGAAILDAWQSGARTHDAIAARLATTFQVTLEAAREAVGSFLKDARSKGLLEG